MLTKMGTLSELLKAMAECTSFSKIRHIFKWCGMLKIKEKRVVVEVWHRFKNVKQNTPAEEMLVESELQYTR